MEFDLENPFTSIEEKQADIVPHLFASESDHMPSGKQIRVYDSFRQEAISLITQAQFSCNFEPFIGYLAVNYMDRFISRREIPQGKPWIVRLIVMSCISLAAKMKNITHISLLSLSKFQREGGLLFDAQTIQKMEFLILDGLKWRMRSITPFSFLSFFISLFKLKDPPLTQALKDRAIDIIFKAQKEIKFVEFKPSLMAASALLLSSHELFPLQFPSFKTSIFSSEYVNKDNLLKCFDTMQEMVVMEGNDSVLDTLSSSRTPLSVLDCQCTKSMILIGENREIKRRKINGFCSETRFQLSRIQ